MNEEVHMFVSRSGVICARVNGKVYRGADAVAEEVDKAMQRLRVAYWRAKMAEGKKTLGTIIKDTAGPSINEAFETRFGALVQAGGAYVAPEEDSK